MIPSALNGAGDFFRLPITLSNTYNAAITEVTECLLDTGATAICVPAKLCRSLGLVRIDLPEPFFVHTADNEIRLDHEFVGLSIEFQGQKASFAVLPVGTSDILLGLPFLQRFDIFLAKKDKFVASRIDFLKRYQLR